MNNPSYYLSQVFLPNGNPASGAKLYSFVAGSTSIRQSLYNDVSLTIPALNPLIADSNGVFPQFYMTSAEYRFEINDAQDDQLYTRDYVSSNGGSGSGSGSIGNDSYKVAITSADTVPGYLSDKLVAGPYISITTSGNALEISSTLTSATSDHKVLTSLLDTTPSYLANKITVDETLSIYEIPGSFGHVLNLGSKGKVSTDGTDSSDYLINKIISNNTPIGTEIYNGKVNLTFDYSKLSGNLFNSPYSVWFSSSNGTLAGTNSFTFGDPSRLGALYTPSLQVMGSAIMGNRAGFWDDQWFTMHYDATGGTVQLTPGYSSTKFIYAHNTLNNASVVTDKASFNNLADGGMVFASMLPNTSEELIYLHTADGLSFNPTSFLLTAPSISTSAFCLNSLSTSGVLVNDASGNVSSVPTATFANDHLVYVDSLDTIPGYLGTKLAAGTNIGFSVTTDSHGDKLWISARSNMLLNPTYTTTNYIVVDTDTCVVSQTNSSITITLPTPAQSYNGRGVEIRNGGTGLLTINTVSGGIRGYTPGISGYGKQLFRCLKASDGNYYWMCGD